MPMLSCARLQVPQLEGLRLLHRGKVRDSYEIDKDRMLVYATDAISIFDVVLNSLVPQKGMILTAMSHFWLSALEKDLNIKTHLLAAGSAIDEHLPQPLRGNPELQAQAMVVRRLKMDPVEFIARGYLTGSGLTSYITAGMICGHSLPPGLQDGDELPSVIDTPTTKAEEGHDLPLNAEAVRTQYPEQTEILLRAYAYMSRYAQERCGIVLADTKLEFGRCERGQIILGDEVGTPDSSRYWEKSEWEASRHRKKRTAPMPFDKQGVRNWGKEQNVAPTLEIPEKLIAETNRNYREILYWTTKMRLGEYQQKKLGIDTSKFH